MNYFANNAGMTDSVSGKKNTLDLYILHRYTKTNSKYIEDLNEKKKKQ